MGVCCCRKNHQRALESMQASFEAEARGKADFVRTKKKLEQDINELEVALDGANRGRAEAEKNVKKLQQQIVEIHQVVDDPQERLLFAERTNGCLFVRLSGCQLDRCVRQGHPSYGWKGSRCFI